MTTADKPRLVEAVQGIMERYERYTRYLNYPGEWGERAFRGWVVYEVFHALLGWPLENIIFGERYDVLFIDNDVRPVVYLETKKPGRGLADFEDFKNRIPIYQTIKHAALANGYEWLRMDIATNTEETIKLIDSDSKWDRFAKHLLAKNFLYGCV